VGDGGLAHRVVGRLGYSRGDGGAAETDMEGSLDVCGQGMIDALVDSVKKHARGPWLSPKHRCFAGNDRWGLKRVMRHVRMCYCVAYSPGVTTCRSRMPGRQGLSAPL
jgi:hypothetical protein